MTDAEEPLPKVQRVDQQQASDRAAVLQDELIRAADRERQLQMQLDKMKDDLSQRQTRLEHRSNLQTDVDVRNLEQEMKQCDSKCVFISMVLSIHW